jgi:large subunit ribosomal protein L1
MTEVKTKSGKQGKKYRNALAQIDQTKKYSIQDAMALVDKVAFAKFDETVDASYKLGVDPKHSDQMVRGAVMLPHGTGKTVRVAVFAKGDKAKEAEGAGAEIVGAEDLVEKIQGGWMEFDKVIATPDMMIAVSKIGKILGPRGLMPNPKLGQVTFEVAKAVGDQKKGKVEYRTDKAGNVHVAIGKKSFGADKLKDNFLAVTSAIVKAKPQTSKGTYMQGVTVSTTMSPGIPVDELEAAKAG